MNKFFIKKKKMFDPGHVIAICGLDGSGKSSLVFSLSESYSRYFCSKVLHLGRPASNPLTFFLPNQDLELDSNDSPKLSSLANRLLCSSSKLSFPASTKLE